MPENEIQGSCQRMRFKVGDGSGVVMMGNEIQVGRRRKVQQWPSRNNLKLQFRRIQRLKILAE